MAITITEIENLPLAELLARKDELIEAAKAADIAELAMRYVQARTDARSFDANQQKQATTLEALTTGLTAADENLTAAKKDVVDAKVKEASAEQSLVTESEKSADLQAKLQAEQTRSAKLKIQADRFVTVVTAVQKETLDAINLQANDDANEG